MLYADESDKLACSSGAGSYCYPIPLTAAIEGGSGSPQDSDRHVLVLDTTGAPNNCTIYELYHSFQTGTGWTADNGAIFPLNTNNLRPDGWTSADAAGLPGPSGGSCAGTRSAAGEINHAIRFTSR